MESEKTHLDDFEARILDRARSALGPSEAQRVQALDRLAATLSTASPGAATALGGSTPRTAFTGASKVAQFSARALILGTSGGLILGLLGGYWAGQTVVEPSPPPPASAVESVSAQPEGRTHVLVPMAPRVDSPSDEDASDENTSDKPQSKAGPTPGPTAIKSNAEESSRAKLTFYEELSYVQRAQAALRDGNGALALGLMDSLDQKPNKGALWAERRVTRALALCQLDRVDDAGRIAREIISRDSARVYHKRLLGSCAGPALSESAQSEKDH